MIAQGLTNAAIAGHLFLSPRTVEAHVRRIFVKTGVRSRTELALMFPPHIESLQAAPERTAPVRISVDLSPQLYVTLAEFTTDVGRDIGVPRLAQAEVIRAMIRVSNNALVSTAIQAALRWSRSEAGR